MPEVWERHGLIAADLMSEYGVDVDSGVLDERSGPWLQRLIDGLFLLDCRLTRSLHSLREEKERKAKGGQ